MSFKRSIHGIDVDAFVAHISRGAELLKNLSDNGEDEGEERIEDVVRSAGVVLFRRALLGDTSAHLALFLLDTEKYDRIKYTLERYDAALETFEQAAPELAGSVPAEVTEENVRRLFFSLLGVERVEEAFKFLEQMWQHISWKSPKQKIPQSTFTSVFSALMAAEMRDEAYALLKDGEAFIDWTTDSSGETVVAVTAAMEIFSVFLALDKYALAKRVITAIKPLVDYPEFLAGLQMNMEENSKQEVEVSEKQAGETPEEIPEIREEIQENPETSFLLTETKIEPKKTKKEKAHQESYQDIPSLLAKTVIDEDQADNPFVLALVKASGVSLPVSPKASTSTFIEVELGSVPSGNPDFPYDYNLSVRKGEESPVGTIMELNDRLHDMILTLVKSDDVKYLSEIPLTVEEFQRKFPRYSDEQYARQITPIVIKVKHALEDPRTYQQRARTTKTTVDFKKKQETSSFFQKKKKRRVSK